MSHLPDRVRVNSDEVAAKVIDGEAIIINLSTGVYYSMDGLGGEIWSLLEAHHDVETIVGRLSVEYRVSAETCRSDVEGLLGQLLEEKLVAPTDERPASPLSANSLGPKRDYAAPELQIYRDMGDLLALDPPVPGLEPIPWDDPVGERPGVHD